MAKFKPTTYLKEKLTNKSWIVMYMDKTKDGTFYCCAPLASSPDRTKLNLSRWYHSRDMSKIFTVDKVLQVLYGTKS